MVSRLVVRIGALLVLLLVMCGGGATRLLTAPPAHEDGGGGVSADGHQRLRSTTAAAAALSVSSAMGSSSGLSMISHHSLLRPVHAASVSKSIKLPPPEQDDDMHQGGLNLYLHADHPPTFDDLQSHPEWTSWTPSERRDKTEAAMAAFEQRRLEAQAAMEDMERVVMVRKTYGHTLPSALRKIIQWQERDLLRAIEKHRSEMEAAEQNLEHLRSYVEEL